MKTLLKILVIVSAIALAVPSYAAPFGWNSFKLGLAKPFPIGSTTPNTGKFTTLEATNTASLKLGTAGSAVGQVIFYNATSGGITLAPVTGALGTPTLLLGTTFTNTKYCTYSTTTGLTCNAEGGESTGASISGTPAQYQIGVWASDSAIGGVAVTGSKVMCTDANGSPVACTNLTDGALSTDNSTANNALYKDGDGHIENLTLNGLTLSSGVLKPGQEIDGHATGNLSNAQLSGTTIYNTGQEAGDVFLTASASAVANLNALFTVGTAQANHFGFCARAGDKIYVIAADGTIAAGDDAACVVMTAAQVGQQFACWTFKTDAYDWACKAIAIGTSTFAAHAAP